MSVFRKLKKAAFIYSSIAQISTEEVQCKIQKKMHLTDKTNKNKKLSLCYKCTGSWVASDQAMRVFSATGLKRLSQRSSGKYTGWPEIHGFPSEKKKGLFWNQKVKLLRVLQQRQRTKTRSMTQRTMPVALKNEVFGLSGKPGTVDNCHFGKENLKNRHTNECI